MMEAAYGEIGKLEEEYHFEFRGFGGRTSYLFIYLLSCCALSSLN
jgi:hypothetical protein